MRIELGTPTITAVETSRQGREGRQGKFARVFYQPRLTLGLGTRYSRNRSPVPLRPSRPLRAARRFE